MGMGHAVYKTTDPRSEVLSRLSKILSDQKKTIGLKLLKN